MHRFRRLGLAAILAAVGGCASPDRTPAPTPVTSTAVDRRPDLAARDKTLLVLLPGRGTSGADFFRQGFISALPAAPVRAVAVDLTFPYYEQRTATRRLHDDIVAPARAAGYRRIWLVGCSVGGLGAFFYDHDFPGEISGIVAIAPFLGEKNVVAEIQVAGGLERWQPRQPVADADFQRQLWLAIRAGRYGQSGHLPLVLAYGTADRFAYGDRLLASTLPPDRVFRTFGFHDWATWHRLWLTVLDSPVSPLGGPARTR